MSKPFFSARHYRVLAAMFAMLPLTASKADVFHAMLDLFERDNPSFDRQLFIKAATKVKLIHRDWLNEPGK